jgi:hypothetical protein
MPNSNLGRAGSDLSPAVAAGVVVAVLVVAVLVVGRGLVGLEIEN